MSIPIIFMHYGDCDYLQYSLLQAKRANPNSDIILISDENRNIYPFVQHASINDSISAQEFSKIYKHRSFNAYEYELFCIQRWFILRDFMVTHKLSQCYHQDSDVMLYDNISTQEDAGFDLAFCGRCATGGIAFINKLEALDHFCTFITKCYTEKPLLEHIENIYQVIVSQIPNGGICDMIFINLYWENRQHLEKIYDLSMIDNNSVFDLNINLADEYEPCYGRKKIYFTNQGVLGKNLSLNKYIRFKGLHFQGEAKNYMKYFAEKIPSECSVPLTFDYSSCQWVEANELN